MWHDNRDQDIVNCPGRNDSGEFDRIGHIDYVDGHPHPRVD